MEAIKTERNTSYGDYILRTGTGLMGQYEQVFGAFFYEKFLGRSRIVDIGPGRCWFPRQDPKFIIAVDNSPEIVEHYSKQGIDIRLGDAYNLGLPDAYVDGVFCCWLFEHLPDPLRAMREIFRVLQSGGFGIIIVPTPHNLNAFYDDYTHVRPYTATALKQLAEDSGFTRHREAFLPYTVGTMRIFRYLGPRATLRYFHFADKFLRRLGLVNKNHQ